MVMKKLNKIVFVDDDVIIGLVSKRLLEQMQCASQVVVYSDSLHALEYMIKEYVHRPAYRQDNTPDLIFLDIEMPGLGGFEILDRLRAAAQENLETLEHVHFVIITSHRGEKEVAKARQYGVHDILEKPLRTGDINKLLTELQVVDDAANTVIRRAK